MTNIWASSSYRCIAEFVARGNYDDALAVCQKDVETTVLRRGEEDVALAEIYQKLSDVAFYAGDFERAITASGAGLRILELNHLAESDTYVLGLAGLAQSLIEVGRFDDAQTTLVRALATLDGISSENSGVRLRVTFQLARLRSRQGNFAEAERLLYKSIRLCVGNGESTSERRVAVYMALAAMFLRSGRRETAVKCNRKAVRLCETCDGVSSFHHADCLVQQSQIHRLLNQRESAIRSAQASVSILQKLCPEIDRHRVFAESYLGELELGAIEQTSESSEADRRGAY